MRPQRLWTLQTQYKVYNAKKHNLGKEITNEVMIYSYFHYHKFLSRKKNLNIHRRIPLTLFELLSVLFGTPQSGKRVIAEECELYSSGMDTRCFLQAEKRARPREEAV